MFVFLIPPLPASLEVFLQRGDAVATKPQVEAGQRRVASVSYDMTRLFKDRGDLCIRGTA